jgi:hypothetical protein
MFRVDLLWIDLLPARPAISPQTYRIDIDVQFVRKMREFDVVLWSRFMSYFLVFLAWKVTFYDT